ncbi:MAG: hypothetical protein JNK82_44630 [Myxococcaceae bacterium]|nr:hypothetical protein [Myxococcaceae bacterium]
MLRALIAAAALAVLASSCGGTKCGDLCYPDNPSMSPCMAPYVCVSPGKCLIISDAGPSSCQ